MTAWALIVSGCGGTAPDDADVHTLGAETSELKNGTLYNGSSMFDGAVGLAIWTPRYGGWNTCSGQVVSRQTILTAAHCVQAVSAANPSWTYVSAWRQSSATGHVTVMPPTWVTMRYNPAFNGNTTYDVGLIIAPTVQPLQNVTSADSGVLAKATPSNVNMYAVGFGYFAGGANDYDYLGRYGAVVPTYSSLALEYFFRNTSTNPEICAGDSGGPLKSTTSGILAVYGVASKRSGGAGLCQPIGHWATTARNMSWLRGKITGECFESSTIYSCW
jgi:hypothetical protein